MLYTRVTSVAFDIPEETVEATQFKLQNPEWTVRKYTSVVIFSESFRTQIRKEQKPVDSTASD